MASTKWEGPTLIVSIGKFEVRFRKLEGKIEEVGRANINGETGPDALYIPPGEYRLAKRLAFEAFQGKPENGWQEPISARESVSDVLGGASRAPQRTVSTAWQGEPWPAPQPEPQQLEFQFPRVPTYPCADFQG